MESAQRSIRADHLDRSIDEIDRGNVEDTAVLEKDTADVSLGQFHFRVQFDLVDQVGRVERLIGSGLASFVGEHWKENDTMNLSDSVVRSFEITDQII